MKTKIMMIKRITILLLIEQGIKKMKKQANKIWLIAITLIFFVMTAFGGIEKNIPMNEVPDAVLKAAQKAVPGIELTEAEVERTLKGFVYEVEGTLDGKEYEIEVSSDGKVLEIEEEENDDEDENDKDNDD